MSKLKPPTRRKKELRAVKYLKEKDIDLRDILEVRPGLAQTFRYRVTAPPIQHVRYVDFLRIRHADIDVRVVSEIDIMRLVDVPPMHAQHIPDHGVRMAAHEHHADWLYSKRYNLLYNSPQAVMAVPGDQQLVPSPEPLPHKSPTTAAIPSPAKHQPRL
jgi:hypothetical protein